MTLLPLLPHLDLILTGYRMGKIDADTCWNLITERDLWPTRDELLLNFAEGRDRARTRAMLAAAPPELLSEVSSLLRAAEAAGHVPFDARRDLERMFPGGV